MAQNGHSVKGMSNPSDQINDQVAQAPVEQPAVPNITQCSEDVFPTNVTAPTTAGSTSGPPSGMVSAGNLGIYTPGSYPQFPMPLVRSGPMPFGPPQSNGIAQGSPHLPSYTGALSAPKTRIIDRVPINKAPICFGPIPDGPPVHFTLVEIIVLLPQWYRTTWFCWRFINNGITPRSHTEILLRHRVYEKKPAIPFEQSSVLENSRSMFGKHYRECMRGMNDEAEYHRRMGEWEARKSVAAADGSTFMEPPPSRDHQLAWTFAKHVVPTGWDPTNISVNGFRPDASFYDSSVPFVNLLQDVAKIPEGHDAADLTRAVLYAQTHQRDTVLGPRQYFFPQHIHEILDIIGRTQITPEHYDGACLARYPWPGNPEFYFEAQDMVAIAPPHAQPWVVLTPLQSLASSGEALPLVHPQMRHLGRVPVLIRLDPQPAEDDMQDHAQIVRFAQSMPHLQYCWKDEHVKCIVSELQHDWITRLNALLDPLTTDWLWRGHLMNNSNIDPAAAAIRTFARSGIHAKINWSAEWSHAGIMARLAVNGPVPTLEDFADAVLNFGDWSQNYSANNPYAQTIFAGTSRFRGAVLLDDPHKVLPTPDPLVALPCEEPPPNGEQSMMAHTQQSEASESIEERLMKQLSPHLASPKFG